jgi:methanogenic corrinoid protein MtbC1
MHVNDDSKQVKLIALITDLAEDATLALVRQRLADGDDPLSIIQDAQQGMRLVGERYEQGQYYISGLIMAGEIFRQVMDLIQPLVEAQPKGEASGTVLIGTVQGDIHDLGKNITTWLLRSHGFQVHDLGVDVPPDQFVAWTVELRPDIVGLSSLLTTSYASMKKTIELLQRKIQEWEHAPVVVIGGSQLDDQVCEYVGADYWCNEAENGIAICQQVVRDKLPTSS